jgi:hypothetical protein
VTDYQTTLLFAFAILALAAANTIRRALKTQ